MEFPPGKPWEADTGMAHPLMFLFATRLSTHLLHFYENRRSILLLVSDGLHVEKHSDFAELSENLGIFRNNPF
ncbi:hypothetical protein DV515_00011571 [Chloebia gouldiae]|uniref:Uncharacterized protein n=1 Tax=Chloebia gouldiae TaxID=44316 RepID=A0A3L8S5Y7_CHLGU|nr:hypothetical protein DV515_00011571 [Chloebia gouldiae]